MPIDIERLDELARHTNHEWKGDRAEYLDWLRRFTAGVIREAAVFADAQQGSEQDAEGEAYNAGVANAVEALYLEAALLDHQPPP